MYRVRSNACMQECVCEIGRCARTNASEFEHRPVSVIKRTGYARTHSANLFIYFFYKNIYILKIFTTNTQTKIFTQ
jgi:hypothetical protein